MANYENDILMQRKDKEGNKYIDYPITRWDNVLEAPVLYNTLTAVSAAFTESTEMIEIFNAMAAPSRLVCNITNGNTGVYPATSGTLTINKTGSETGTATFIDAVGRVSAATFTVNSSGGGGTL